MTPSLGIRNNIRQFSLLVAINAFVGAMVGLERTVLPLLAEREFHIASASVALSFLVAFGLVKAFSNLAAGRLSDTIGRRPLLIVGWVAALPVAPMIVWAPSWGWVVAANVLLGVNQGFAWSTTVIMKIDLAGPRQRGLAMGVNELAGYGAVAVVAFVTANLAATHGPRPVPYLLGFGFALGGLILSLFAKETSGHARAEGGSSTHQERSFRDVFVTTSFRDRTLRTVCQAGLVNNLNDAMAWGLLPIFLAGRGLSLPRIGIVAALYPASWTLSQLYTGPLSDRVGPKPLVVSGLWVQAVAIVYLVVADSFVGWVGAAVGMGIGTALVYPSLLAAIGDASHPAWRASALGVYRLWRDLGYAAGAVLSGYIADVFSIRAAILAVAVMTGASGVVVVYGMKETRKEVGMRSIDCPCGHKLEAATDEDLFSKAKEHMTEHHPNMQRTDDQIRERVAADARDV